ncbi:unnamed protein product [Brassicogethes aeneus]|uniref:Serendipity locus protein alpha n=1 Tax=Brassicogethes aeneus TaxID=1431903 RepID=A0A9P0B192_BRAAE|nr:unnamed protein product [Brassicogethes aeneus]
MNFQFNTKKKIQKCRNFVQSLNAKISTNKEILIWFKELCEYFVSLINLIVENRLKLKKHQIETLLLHLKQLSTLLSLFINIFVRESEVKLVLTEARNCTIKQLLYCLDAVEDSLTNDNKNETTANFIDWMDKSLDKIAEMHEANGHEMQIYKEAKLVIEEVLCHAMSIAQVALPEDCKMLKGSSQSVLNSMESLITEILKFEPNKAMVKLFTDNCVDRLCSLETKVNTAVLRLSLHVFSDYTSTFDQIHKFCLKPKNKNQMDTLDFLVANFDLHVDRLMQIGLFAVSVTSPKERKISIKSCLASLEGLESELVPAFTTVLLDSSIHNINFTLLLKNHWLQEAKSLQQLIFLIIDPLAFCQVIYDENKQILEHISEIAKNGINMKVVEPFVKNANVLKEFLPIAIKESEKGKIDCKELNISFTNFKIVFYELKAACKVFLTENNSTNIEIQKIMKRCKILMSLIKNIRSHFVHQDFKFKTEITSCSDDDIPKTNKFMDHLVNRGSEIIKNRSILYKSSNKIDFSNSAAQKIQILKGQKNKSIPLSKLVHLKKFSVWNAKDNLNSTLDSHIEISNILKDLTNLSNSLISNK